LDTGVETAWNRFLFTGREWFASIEELNYRSRMYSPKTGVFTSRDSLGFAAGDTNLIRYVKNSPTNFVDPSGNIAILDTLQLYVQALVIRAQLILVSVPGVCAFSRILSDGNTVKIFDMILDTLSPYTYPEVFKYIAAICKGFGR
jgi:RHS repeat-associated protein